jgi:FHA domain-containing protein
MDAVMLIEQTDPHGHRVLRQRFEGAGTECRIGRDLGCDIVVDDDHAAPHHALLTLLEDGRVNVRDLGTRNGTRVDGNRVPADAGAVIEQGEIIVGRTRLRVRTRHTPIEPERVFRREFVRRHRTMLAAAGVSACIAYGGFLQWLDAPSSMLRSITTAVLVVLGLIALWTGLWALATKLNHGSWHVRVHLTIASVGAAFCAWGYWVAGLVAFAAQWSVLVQIGVAVIGAVALVALYLHLREATHYGRRIALTLAGAATVVIATVAWIISIGVEDGDVSRVDLGPDVRLGAGRVVPNRDIADYLAGVDRLQLAAGRERQKSLLNAPLADADD